MPASRDACVPPPLTIHPRRIAADHAPTPQFAEYIALEERHFSYNKRQLWNERRELPEDGTLRLRYVDSKPKQQTTIHYSLDLAEPSQREVAISLWQRATVEPGENWMNETLDDEPFQVAPSSRTCHACPSPIPPLANSLLLLPLLGVSPL